MVWSFFLAATREMLKKVFTVEKLSAKIKYTAGFSCVILIAYFYIISSTMYENVIR